MGAAAGYKPDQLGGLEIVKWRTGSYVIRETGQDEPVEWTFVLPRKRNAAAVRQMLLDAAGGNWADLPHRDDGLLDAGRFDDEAKDRARQVFRAVKSGNSRHSSGQCLCCGYREDNCYCGEPVRDGDPARRTAADMEWAR